MGWKEVKEKLDIAAVSPADQASHKLNEELFAAAWGWDFPLFGAATTEFNSVTRETERTDFVHNEGAAIFLARQVFPDCTLSMKVAADGTAFVTMSAPKRGNATQAMTSTSTASSLSIAITSCVADLATRVLAGNFVWSPGIR